MTDRCDFCAELDRMLDAFYRETGVWPPSRSRPLEMGWDGISDDDRWARWNDWLRTRNAVATDTGHRSEEP